MKGTTIVYLCGLFLAVLSGAAESETWPCQIAGSMMPKLACMTPAGSDGESENSTNEVQHNRTEEMRLNDTAEMFKTNETVAEKSTEQLKARVKRTNPDLKRKPWDPFSSNGSGFALQSENEATNQQNKTTMEEMRLNETAGIIKANETVAEELTTQLPKTTEK